MNLTIEKAKEISKGFILKPDSLVIDMENFFTSKGFIEGWNQAIEKCAGIVDRQLDIESETGGEKDEISIAEDEGFAKGYKAAIEQFKQEGKS